MDSSCFGSSTTCSTRTRRSRRAATRTRRTPCSSIRSGGGIGSECASRFKDLSRRHAARIDMSNTLRFAVALLVVSLAACADREEAAAPLGAPAGNSERAPAPPPPAAAADYAAAVATPGRLAEDREQDAQRKPADVLAFFGVQPGTTVLDLYSGAGYFTELLAAVVGPTGRVVAHNNRAYLDGTEAQWAERLADPQRLANVERLTAENNQLELHVNQFGG